MDLKMVYGRVDRMALREVVECVNGWRFERDGSKSGLCGSETKTGWSEWSLLASLFADDTVLLAENDRELQSLVDEFNCVCV